MILVIAATEPELTGANGVPTLACGIGPVESAATTARALADLRPAAVLHVGIAGARLLPAPSLVIGSESVYEDAAHGYTMADTPAYQQEGAERHFRELFALLERTLGVGAGAA